MAPAEQTAVQVVSTGDDFHSVLRVVSQPVVQPLEGEVLVRVLLRPVNPADVFKITGANPQGVPFPFNVGNEGFGRVEANGPGCSKFDVGQRVVAASWPGHAGPPPNGRPFGTFQQYLPVPEKDLLPAATQIAVPDDIDDETAAQFFINPATALGMLETLAVPKGDWLLQTAAGSAVGRAIIAIANRQGVRTINLVRRQEQRQQLLDLGADEVICTSDEDFVKRVAEITGGRGAYGAVDSVGGSMTKQLVASVRKGGTVLVYGAMSGVTGEIGLLDVIYGGKTVTGFAVLRWTPAQKAACTWQRRVEELFQYLREGVVKLPVGKVFPLEHAADAVEHSMRPGRGDKVLLRG